MTNEKEEESENILDQQKQQQIANTFNPINNNINKYFRSVFWALT